MTKLVHENVQNTADFPFKIFEFRAHNLKRVIPFHWHQSTEILYCGSGKLNIKLSNNNYLLNKGDFIVINPYEVHSTKSPEINWVLCLQLPYKFLSELTNNSFYNHYIFKANSCIPSFKDNHQVKKLLREILKLRNQANNNLVINLKIITLVLATITNLTENYSIDVEQHEQSKNIKFIEEVTDFLDQNFAKEISLCDIAKHFSYSSSYTSRLIKSSLGINFSELLKIIRVNKAVDLFNTTNLHFIDIAEKTGFKTYRNLYNAFYQTYHMSPKEFFNRQK